MLIVLPPSETKAHGGSHPPLNLDSLSFPSLNSLRPGLIARLEDLSSDLDEAMRVLGISEKLRPEAESNRSLRTSPTMPALQRYTGVLFDALDAPSLPPSAWQRLAVGSALFGVVRAGDLIPHYRLSAGTKLAGPNGRDVTMKARWGTAITEALASEDLLVDLRSGAYQQLGRVPGAVTVRVVSTQPDGSRKVVSHFNKHYKGELARVLALAPEEPESVDDILAIVRAAGMEVEHTSAKVLTVVV